MIAAVLGLVDLPRAAAGCAASTTSTSRSRSRRSPASSPSASSSGSGSRSGSRCWRSSGAPGTRTTRCSAASTGRKGYHDIGRHPDAALVPGPRPLPLRRAALLRERRLLPRAGARAWRTAPQPVRMVVVAAEPITDVDTTAADMLIELARELEEGGVELAFAELKGPRQGQAEAYGLLELIGEHRFFPTRRRRRARLRRRAPAWTGTTGRTRRPTPDVAQPSRPPSRLAVRVARRTKVDLFHFSRT